MSLVYGGRFDKDNNWAGGHGEHRIGINADISHMRGVDQSGACVDVNPIQLRAKIRAHTRGQLLREPDHFHIRES
jgi:hypothetical protein